MFNIYIEMTQFDERIDAALYDNQYLNESVQLSTNYFDYMTEASDDIKEKKQGIIQKMIDALRDLITKVTLKLQAARGRKKLKSSVKWFNRIARYGGMGVWNRTVELKDYSKIISNIKENIRSIKSADDVTQDFTVDIDDEATTKTTFSKLMSESEQYEKELNEILKVALDEMTSCKNKIKSMSDSEEMDLMVAKSKLYTFVSKATIGVMTDLANTIKKITRSIPKETFDGVRKDWIEFDKEFEDQSKFIQNAMTDFHKIHNNNPARKIAEKLRIN